MTPSASLELRATHPLTGAECWPKSGPIYDFGDEGRAPRAATFWERIGERFRKPPQGEHHHPAQARIWY